MERQSFLYYSDKSKENSIIMNTMDLYLTNIQPRNQNDETIEKKNKIFNLSSINKKLNSEIKNVSDILFKNVYVNLIGGGPKTPRQSVKSLRESTSERQQTQRELKKEEKKESRNKIIEENRTDDGKNLNLLNKLVLFSLLVSSNFYLGFIDFNIPSNYFQPNNDDIDRLDIEKLIINFITFNDFSFFLRDFRDLQEIIVSLDIISQTHFDTEEKKKIKDLIMMYDTLKTSLEDRMSENELQNLQFKYNSKFNELNAQERRIINAAFTTSYIELNNISFNFSSKFSEKYYNFYLLLMEIKKYINELKEIKNRENLVNNDYFEEINREQEQLNILGEDIDRLLMSCYNSKLWRCIVDIFLKNLYDFDDFFFQVKRSRPTTNDSDKFLAKIYSLFDNSILLYNDDLHDNDINEYFKSQVIPTLCKVIPIINRWDWEQHELLAWETFPIEETAASATLTLKPDPSIYNYIPSSPTGVTEPLSQNEIYPGLPVIIDSIGNEFTPDYGFYRRSKTPKGMFFNANKTLINSNDVISTDGNNYLDFWGKPVYLITDRGFVDIKGNIIPLSNGGNPLKNSSQSYRKLSKKHLLTKLNLSKKIFQKKNITRKV